MLKFIIAAAAILLVEVQVAPAHANTLLANRLAASAAADCGAPACTPTPVCAPACEPKIIYRHVGRKVCCPCDPPIQSALEVKDPAAKCGCPPVLIPVCLPACCLEVPKVSSHCGLLGRGVVRYDYCCGLSIKVVFRNSGDIVVTYIHG